MIKDTLILEKVQRQRTKFILRDYHRDYKSHLNQLPLIILCFHHASVLGMMINLHTADRY